MTPRFLAQEKKIRLLVLFLFVLLLFLAFRLLQPGILKSASKVVVPASVQVAPGGAKRLGAQFPQLNDAHFMGLRRATAQEIREALPEAQGKPALIAFSSRMCHDCQRLKPVVERRFPNSPPFIFVVWMLWRIRKKPQLS
jgi:thioredoxin-related protein